MKGRVEVKVTRMWPLKEFNWDISAVADTPEDVVALVKDTNDRLTEVLYGKEKS